MKKEIRCSTLLPEAKPVPAEEVDPDFLPLKPEQRCAMGLKFGKRVVDTLTKAPFQVVRRKKQFLRRGTLTLIDALLVLRPGGKTFRFMSGKAAEISSDPPFSVDQSVFPVLAQFVADRPGTDAKFVGCGLLIVARLAESLEDHVTLHVIDGGQLRIGTR